MIRTAVNAPVKVTMVFAAIALLGWISLQRLPTSLFPDIRTPRVTTQISTTGLSPREVERRINEPLERQLYTLRGVRDVTTFARADQAVIVTEFTWDTDLDFAFLDVKKEVGDLRQANAQDIESATVLRYDPNAAPVVTVTLVNAYAPVYAPGDPYTPPVRGPTLEELRRFAEQTLKPRFERLEGVANVVIAGGIETEISISLDEKLLIQYDITVESVVQALEAENVNATGGFVDEGTERFLLKAIGEFETIEDVSGTVVTRKQNTPIRLGEIATITRVPKQMKDYAMVAGRPSVGLLFYREAEGNTVAIARSVREELAIMAGNERVFETDAVDSVIDYGVQQGELLPEGTAFVVVSDRSAFIQSAIREVRNNALLGGVLAAFVLFLFLRDIRTTLLVTVAIPVSIIATFNLMYIQGLSLNLMTLGGLALGVGMLVDNAIVVLENIFRMREKGSESLEAAKTGTQQVAGAIVAATLTTVIVFLPIVYVRGVAGLLFREQALTVVYSLAASLLVGLFLIPMLASRFVPSPPKSMLHDNETELAPKNLYTNSLLLFLKLRWLVVIAAVGVVWWAWSALQTISQEFLPRTDQRQFAVRLVLPNETPIESTLRVAQTVSMQASRYAPAIESVYMRVGESEGKINATAEDPDGSYSADFEIRVHDWNAPTSEALAAGVGTLRSGDIVDLLKPSLDSIPEARATFQLDQGSLMSLLGTDAAPLMLEISGQNVDTLAALSQEIARRFSSVPGLANVRTNILEGAPEVRVVLNPALMSRYGLDVQSVANTIRQRLEGRTAGSIRADEGDVDMRVEVDLGVESVETVKQLAIQTPAGAVIPLETIAEFEIEEGPREIVRRRQSRVARVMADLDGVELSEGIGRAEDALTGLRFPTGYTTSFTGEEEQRAQAFEKLQFALILSIVLVYMVMASVFESFVQPLLIMLTIPLAGVGVVAAFLLTNQTVNVMSLIGVVMLGGIVVNNAIVLLDCVNQVRRDGDGDLSARESLIAGCNRRLRPVLMTTMTTLLGLLPLALGLGAGAELRQSLALAVLGGLASSTLLTLYVIPVGQSFIDSISRKKR